MIKTWLITGSARGLGRSITEAALAAGNNVVATARDPGRLADLQARYPDTLLPFALDVTDAEAAKAAASVAIDTFGRIDVLVNNAGFGHTAPFEQTTAEDFRAQVDTNFYGVVNLIRAVLPGMRHRHSGHIINISSVGGRNSTPGLSAYQAAKWAVGGFTEVLAKETASFGVKLISVEPGGMRTDWGEIARGNAPALLPDYEPSVGAVLALLKNYVGHEIGDPAKIARIILDLAERETLPAHLLLGSDALYTFARADGVRQKEAAEWASVSASSDFDGTDLVALQKLLSGRAE
ncbi:SDR family NAD(P)-dependent oxidoreductase [Bosea sp. BK604]|uniref:SDR family NAD(P)-dependent oxidoreductase n=1 Tax=Bosea sp. BK604 TaxID=2512180 RepID=UPI001045A46D|nr:SDR family NAD(P)-dependent oxidoreductase [Bosea sp. BK604]TCR69625.1 NADP-dependent 3-hydroxy acid dehydrogenase YdfG [Bosea sp. BK604]